MTSCGKKNWIGHRKSSRSSAPMEVTWLHISGPY